MLGIASLKIKCEILGGILLNAVFVESRRLSSKNLVIVTLLDKEGGTLTICSLTTTSDSASCTCNLQPAIWIWIV